MHDILVDEDTETLVLHERPGPIVKLYVNYLDPMPPKSHVSPEQHHHLETKVKPMEVWGQEISYSNHNQYTLPPSEL